MHRCWPFPSQEKIQKEFPDNAITAEVYKHAKTFYDHAINIETPQFHELMRKNNHEGEQKLVSTLINQAVLVGLGYKRKKH
jgi:hypothetical protein